METYSLTELQQQLVQCQQQLQASERRFRSIIEKNADGILIIDGQGVIRFTNPAVEKILGRTEAKLRESLFGFPVVAGNTTELDIIDQGQVRAIVEMRVMETEWGGEPAYVASLRDITERKKAEEILKIAKKEAEGANRAKGQFLANMSHELRTPLNAILGYAQILQREQYLTEKQQHGLDIIKRNGEYLLTLLNDILDISKIEVGKFDLHSNTFELNSALKSVIEVIRFQAQQKGIAFFYDRDDGLPEQMYGDEKRLRQILLNVLGNAVKFTDQGSLTFRVKFHIPAEQTLQARQKPTIRFEVQDTGKGIAAEHLETIFLPFEQIKEVNSPYEGVGLGLAISKRLVQLMGSTLHVMSAPGKGSTFWFDLDAPEMFMASGAFPHAEAQNPFNPPRSLSSGRIIGYHGKLRRVLLADATDSNRAMLKDVLLPVGFEIIEAINTQDVFNKTCAYHPDVILIDLGISAEDACETIRRIRQFQGCQNTVVLGISASIHDQIRQKSLAAGCHDLLTKPVLEPFLFDMLQFYLNIAWVYEDDRGWEQDAQYCQHQSIPTHEEIRKLYDLAIIGDVLAIREHIKEIDRQDPGYALFVSKIRKPAQALNLVELQRVLQQYLEQNAR